MDRAGNSLILVCSVVVLLHAPLRHIAAEDSESNQIQSGLKAEPVTRTAPAYPLTELNKGRQGWVQLSYVVTEEGKVIDPVVQDSSGSRLFEKAALKTVEDWLYKPATWNGEPVQQCQNEVMITFAIEGEETNVSRSFNRLYRKVNDKLAKGDLESAKKILDESFEPLNMTLTEVAWYSALEVKCFGQTGDKSAQLDALHRATASGGQWVDDEVYPQLLLVKTIRELEAGNISAGLSAYQDLEETGADLPEMATLQTIIERLQASVASDDILSVPARVPGDADCDDCNDNWDYRLLRQKFSLAGIDGELGNLEIRCSRKRIVDRAREGISWEIPDSWGSCLVIVFGEPGTTFSLLEEPSA